MKASSQSIRWLIVLVKYHFPRTILYLVQIKLYQKRFETKEIGSDPMEPNAYVPLKHIHTNSFITACWEDTTKQATRNESVLETTCSNPIVNTSSYFLSLFVYFFYFRQRKQEQGRGAEKERIPSRLHTAGTEPSPGLHPRTLGS